jgi:hypothetical protein
LQTLSQTLIERIKQINVDFLQCVRGAKLVDFMAKIKENWVKRRQLQKKTIKQKKRILLDLVKNPNLIVTHCPQRNQVSTNPKKERTIGLRIN